MPRPGDWDAIGLGGDPTPGDPEKINALAEGFQKMGGKAREILTAIETVMNKNDDSVFVGQTADALRGKVDGRLRGHVESVASAFETSATALREWRGVVVEQQAKADAALNAGRGLAEDDPERDNHKNSAKAAGDFQSEQASSYAGRINGVSDIKMPISDCEVFWEAFKWLAIILIIPALIFGGPIALLALAVNLALFIKTIVDVAKGDAGFLDLFLAGLGLIAPTTKALPIFSIVKAIGKGIGAGVKGIANTFKNVFSKDFLFNGLLAGLKSMPMLANIAIKETGLFVVKNIRNFPLNAANFGNNFGKIALNGIKNLGTGFANLPSTVFRGLGNLGKGFATGAANTWKFVTAHFGNLQWTRIFLPVAADEIRAFKALGLTNFQAFTQALKVGVIGRGVLGKNVFGMPMTSAIGKGISAIPIDTGAGASGWSKFVSQLTTPEIRIPMINVKGIGDAAGAGFNAGHAFTALDDLNVGNLGAIKNGDLGVSIHTPTVVSPGGVHMPANVGTNIPTVPIAANIPSPHIGAPQMPSNIVGNLVQPQVGTPVLPIHIATGATPPPVHVETPHFNGNGVVANVPSPHIGAPDFGNNLHLNNLNVQSPGLNNIGSLHVPTPSAHSAGLSDLSTSAIRNNAPVVSPHFGTSIGEGAGHGFQANHFKVSIDEILNAPSGTSFHGVNAIHPPAIDRINAALDLVHNPGAITQGVTPPSIHTAKPVGTDVNVNVHLNGGADFKPPAPATIRVDNPGLAGAQNMPTIPTVNIQPIHLPNRAADLHIQPTTVHTTGQGTTNLPSTNLPSTNLPGQVGVPGHGLDAKAAMPDTQLVPLHPQPAPALHSNPGVNSAGVNGFDNAALHTPTFQNPALHNPGMHNPGMHNPGVRDPGYSLLHGSDIGNSGHGTNTIASRSEIHLPALTDRPGAYVTVERTEGGMSSYALYGGGPDGRMDVLAGGNIRFTDTATGNTTRFDSGGIVLDQGLRLTKTDGVLRPLDHIVVTKGGEFRATTLTGDLAPGVKVTKLDNGGIQLVDEKGVTFHYNAQGKLENQPLSAAWDQDLAAKAGVFRQPGDTDAIVNAKMADFGQVQRAQTHFDNALDNVAVHGGRLDGPSTGPAVGDQVHIDLRAAETDLATAKATFEGKHSLSVDGLQQQLDKLTIDSLKERPRLLGGVSRSFDLPGGGGMKFELNGGQISFSGPKADAFSSTLNGRTLTIIETGGAGQAAHTWTYSLGFGGRANQIGESFPLNGGLFDGRPINLNGTMGNFDKAMVTDLRGNPLPVKVGQDGFTVPSPQGPMAYDQSGVFRALDPSTAGHLPKAVPPPHLAGDDLIRWNAQADISRTHLTVAAENKIVDLLMKDVAGGSFTSKKGFEGYVNPTALADGTLVGKVNTFESVAKDLAFKGPEDNITVYRGVSMDPGSAQAAKFTERLPISTSSTMKFQDEWAKNGVNSNRVVFEIDVPAGHSKLSMSYPEGYKPVKGDAPEVNASQFEVTLAPTTFVRTGPNRTLDNGMTIIPVKAEQIPPSMYDSVITAKWPGMSSETAFGDFAKSFELSALKQFPDLENVVAKSVTSTDGLTHTVTVSKPGFEGHDLTITVMRDPKADSVRVTIASDGANKFDQSWTKTDFSNIATDLRGGVLHNNEKFTNFAKPWAWEKATPFRADGLSDAQVLQRMDDWAGVEKAQIELDSIKRDFGPQTGRVDGSSNAPSVGDQARIEIRLAEQQLVEAKATFTQLHNLNADATADWLAALKQSDLKLNPGLLGASGRPGRGVNLPGAGDVQLVRGGGGYKLSEGADGFRMSTGADGNMIVQKLGDGDVVLHSWTLRPGFRPSVIAETLTLGDGPLAGKFLDLQGTAGKLDGVIDDARGGLPVKADSDGIVVAAPGGVFKYDSHGFFQGPGAHLGDDLGRPALPPGLAGDGANRWNAQVDLSRTHLGEAGTSKPVENLMKDVAGGSFTSKKGYGGYVSPIALEDGTLLGKMQNFHNVTQDLLTKGPADNITLYRGVSMDPAAAKADAFTERLPISTSSSVKFQDEWAKNGVNSNRVVFEIDVPPAHNKLSMSYPEGYKPGAGESKAWNQDQFEVTLAPTTFVRTGPNHTLDNGITVIPVKAEMIPPSAYNDVITQKWGGLSSATAFDDFAKSFELNALRQFPDLENVTSKSVLSGDGMINKITVGKPGFDGNDMHITVTRDPQADSVRVTVDADGATKFDKSWSGQQFSNLATDLRGGVLHNNEQFTNLPQPAAWKAGDELGGSVPLDVKGKGKSLGLEDAWAKDLANKMDVFRRPGESDAIVTAKMEDFRQVQQAQLNVKYATADLAEHGHRFDGTSTDLPVGIQMRIQLGQAEADLKTVTSSFQAKHGMQVDTLNQQLDDLLQTSLKERPGLRAGAPSQFPVPEGGAMFKLEGSSVSFSGGRADAFEGVLDGRALKIIETNADGAVVRTLDYELNARNWPILKSDQLTLNGGELGGQKLHTGIDTGKPSGGSVIDVHGNEMPVRFYQDNFQIPSSSGAMVYDRGGNFLHIDSGLNSKMGQAVPPAHLTNETDIGHWAAQADLSRTHLTAAAKYDHVSDMMVKIREGAFTSKKGFDGYLDPSVLSKNLTNDVRTFNEVAKDVLFDGPVAETRVYRGVAMDSASADAKVFTERIPPSTSSNWEFQKTWAKDADLSKRVVFQIDVPPGHGKLSMAYPEGYKPGAGEAKAWNQGQFEVTLSPTVLERTGDNFVKDGMTVIPVRARQIPDSQLDGLINQKWPGMSSASAFDDFARGFDQASLQKFPGMADVTSTSKTTDNLVHEIVVSKPGANGHDLTITVTRDVDADAVRVTVTADGKTSFNHSWSQQQFANIATDLKAGTLHDNDLFVSMSKPAEWNKQTFSAQWSDEFAAKANIFRQAGDSDAMVGVKMEDFSRIRTSEFNLKQAELNANLHGGRPDGPSSGGGISVGDQVRMDVDVAQADLDTAKIGFKRKHSMDPDQLSDELGRAVKPKLAGAGRQFEVPGGGVSYQVENGVVQFTGTRAGEFTGAVNGREITVTQLAANGDTVATWTFRQGFGRPNLTAHTIHLGDGPLAGQTANLHGIAGQLDGTLGDTGIWPMKVVGDELFVATPGGPLRYGRDGVFHGPAPTGTSHLPQPTLPTNVHGNPAHWNNQVDLSRTHLTEASTSKPVENLMKDVMGGSFTSKRGFGGYVKPLALADGTLVQKTQDFVNITRDLLLKGPDGEVTLYRGVAMDPASAQAAQFVDRLPSSTSNNLSFQAEWARNGVSSNRFVFEIEVPAGHGKLSMSYPPGYQALPDEARAWNQSQWEVTLAPTTLVRTGENRVVDGMTIIPVRAEQIPVGQLAGLIRETPPPMPLQNAFDDFVQSFDQGTINRWEGFDNVSVTKTTSVDGNLTTITAIKPGYADTLSIQVSKDLDTSTVSVKIDGGASEFSKGWKNTELGDLGAQLRGKVLHDSDLFLHLPQPGSWANEPVVVNMMLQGLPDTHVNVGNTGGRATHELVGGPPGSHLETLPNGDFRLTDGTKSYKFGGGDGLLVERRFQVQNLDGLTDVDVRFRPATQNTAGGYDLINTRPGQQVTALDNGGFRITEGNRSWGFDGDGIRLDHQFHLTGTNDGHALVHPVGGGQPHFDGPNANQLVLHQLDDGGFRVIGGQGHTQRYGMDGLHVNDGLAITDRNSLRGVLFTEPDGAGGIRVVDLQGTPVPNTHSTQLPNGQTMVVDDGMHDVQWFGRDGVRQGVGVQVAHADFPNGQAFLFRAEGGGNVSFIDNLGAHLPHQVDVLQGGGFRLTDPGNGIARTFDDAGAAIDRRIPLGQPNVPVNQQLIAVHDVHGNVSIVTRADAPGPGTIELTGAGGYRALDGGNYHVYNADGAFEARGVAVTLHGENGFLEITTTGAQRVDAQYQPIAGRQVTFNGAAGEITVSRVGGEDVFNLQGVPVRQVTDLDGLGASQLGGRVTRDQNGGVTFVDNAGAPMPNRYHATVDAQGNTRVEIQLNGSPRNGEYHQYSRTGQLTEQGFPVVNNGQPTVYKYVVDRANSTWTRTGGTQVDGVFQSGKVEVTGVGNGQIKLISSSAKEVQVFERRWLPGGEIMDSFRKTDTLGFGNFSRRTTWVTYDNAGGLSNWGKREFDTSGFSWRDVDHRGNAQHHYQQGLQKYDNPIADEIGPMGKAEKEITGHVIATRGADGTWTWNRFDADGLLVGSGPRTWESLGDGFTDRVTLQVNGAQTTEIAQQKFGNWHSTSTANQYKEFKLETGANGLERPGNWEIQGKAGKPIGTGTKLHNDDILSAVRVGEQRPPVWFRDYVQRNPVPDGNVSHVANDGRYQIYRWEATGATNPGHGVRYVAGDESFIDVGLDGRFVRFEGKLHDGSKLKVGDQVEPLTDAHPNPGGGAVTAWENDGTKGWRIFDNATNSWEDFKPSMGPHQPGQGPDWISVRQSRPGGEVREFPEAGNNHIWVQRDAHGNLVGSSHQIPTHGPNAPIRFIEATGPADGSRWAWRELDVNGNGTGATGERFHFKGSRDESIAWDNSFRDFDAGGNLVRDRNMLDEGRYVESWNSGNNNWHSAEFDKLGQRVDDAMTFDRTWSNGTGTWSGQWNPQSTHFRDVTPNGAAHPNDVRFETPQHIGDGRPVRVREYHVDANGHSDLAQWKEFDIDKIVRERAASGANYLETDKLHGQWKLWDNNGRVVGERSDTGLVFELRGDRLTLTGNEFDFRGSMTEFRGWNSRIGDAQRQPWHLQSDWTFDPKGLQAGGNPLRMESNYVAYSRLLSQKMLLTIGTEFVLDYAASLIIMGIIAEAQNKPFSGNDALKALMNAAVGTTLRTVAGTALTETRLGGGLRDLKQTMGNLDGGKLITNRPNNNSSQWGVEWAGNTSVAKWRGGAFDYGFGMMMLPLTGFVNGTMNAAIFGVRGKDGKTHTVGGWQALAEGGMSVATGYAIANSIGMLRTIGMGLSAGRFFQKGGLADMATGFGLKFFEKGMASLLAPALRASMNPEWSRPDPKPQPLILPPSVNVPQPQMTSGGVILPPGVQLPPTAVPQTPTP